MEVTGGFVITCGNSPKMFEFKKEVSDEGCLVFVNKHIKLLCRDAKFCDEMEHGLISRGVVVSANAVCTLLVDEPWGWIQAQLCDIDACDTIILTNNPCPEYKLDLLAHQPAALFAHMSLVEVVEGLEFVWQRQYLEPKIHSPLTPTERLTLHLLAKGYTPKKIASVRNISEGRVKNTLSTIYQKLGLGSRAQLALYYFGLWHVLAAEGWEPLRYVRDLM